MTKKDRQSEQLKQVSPGGQHPGTNWGTTPGEAGQSNAGKPAGNRQGDRQPDAQKSK